MRRGADIEMKASCLFVWCLPSLQVHLLLCGAILNLGALSGQCGACRGRHTHRQLRLIPHLTDPQILQVHFNCWGVSQIKCTNIHELFFISTVIISKLLYLYISCCKMYTRHDVTFISDIQKSHKITSHLFVCYIRHCWKWFVCFYIPTWQLWPGLDRKRDNVLNKKWTFFYVSVFNKQMFY